MQAGNDTFLVGSSATAPDFHAWEMLDQFTMLAAHVGAPDPLAGFPHLKAFHTRFAELPGNSTYHACALARLPCNNKVCGQQNRWLRLLRPMYTHQTMSRVSGWRS